MAIASRLRISVGASVKRRILSPSSQLKESSRRVERSAWTAGTRTSSMSESAMA
jgi:hypothetical protein